MQLSLSLTRPTAVEPSPNVLRIASMFGLGLDRDRSACIVPPIALDLRGGQIIFITGASGGGKTSLLNLIAAGVADRRDARVIRFDQLAPPADRPLVDCFGDLPLERVTTLLSLAGLNDAFVMLRRPSELSDGQRYRFRLAQTMAMVEADRAAVRDECTASIASPAVDHLDIVLADEFGATLDRLTAQIIARNVRKWVTRQSKHEGNSRDSGEFSGVCFVAATTHDDLLEAMQPDVLIVKHPGQAIEILSRV